MRITILFFIVSLILTACIPTQRSTARKNSSSDDPVYANPETPYYTGTESRDEEVEPTPVATSSLPDEIAHCQWSTDGSTGFSKSSSHLGNYSLCQVNETDIYIQLQTPVTDCQVCIIPTYNSSSSNLSIYIGEPRCIYITDATKIYKVTMLKNRSGYTNFSITGVMIMKDKMYAYGPPFGTPYINLLSPDAYLFCSNWLSQTGNSAYCQTFVSVGQYVYHQF